MYSTAASMAAEYSGKVPSGSPWGFCRPITIGSPSAFSGFFAAHSRHPGPGRRPSPRSTSMLSSGSQGSTPAGVR